VQRRELAWKAVSTASGVAAAGAVRRVAAVAWERSRGRPAPTGPATREHPWSEALLWAATVAVGVAVARVAAERAAVAVWERVTGSAPPSFDGARASRLPVVR